MNKETKQLNIFLAVVAVVGIAVPFMLHGTDRQIEPVQIQVDNTEVTRDTYRAIYMVSASCDIETEILAALDDDKITITEAMHIGNLCEADALQQASKPFERGMLKQELQYIKTGGVSM